MKNHNHFYSRSARSVLLFIPSLILAVALFSNLSHCADIVAQDDRLCPDAAAPDAAPEKVHISCEMESKDFAPQVEQVPGRDVKVVAYNLERGLEIDDIISVFKTNEALKNADIILASELDRGCPRTGSINVPEKFAEALGMNYIYAVEFVELQRSEDGTVTESTCEHGNALFSRFPIQNPRQIRHSENDSWYKSLGAPSDQPRLGGRIALTADFVLPNSQVLKAYSVHFESSVGGNSLRAAQARELIRDAGKYRGPVIIGGDMNTGFYFVDLAGNSNTDKTPRTLRKGGFKDAHKNIPANERGTTQEEIGTRLVLDLIFTRSIEVKDAGICPPEMCGGLSDHLPVWAILSAPADD